MVRRPRPVWVVAVCGAAGFIVAVALLDGATRGLVAVVSGVVLLVAVTVGLTNEKSRAQERQIDARNLSGGGPPPGI